MKKLTLTLCAVMSLTSAVIAGTETYKSSKQVATEAPCPTWYADNEWNIGLSGIYAPTVNDWEDDTFLNVDHGWGGAIDVKYFFRRYFGLGIQGFGIWTNTDQDDDFFDDDDGFFDDDDDDQDWAGGLLGTFTFRYPIPCSRFAPYGWVGFGGVWGGNDDNDFSFDDEDNLFDDDDDGDAHIMAQYGAGFEVRFSQHFGWTNDVSYNHVEGGHNDFWQIRTGLNFAF